MYRKKGIIYGLGITLLVIVLFIFLPNIYNNTSFLFNLMLYMALAEGLNIIYGFTGYLPFGYVGFFGAGAYSAALAILFLHFPPLIAVLVGGIGAFLIGIIFIPLLKLSGAYFAIANLAASQALYYIVANPNLEKITQGPYGISLANIYNPQVSYYVMLSILAFSMVTVIFIRFSDYGLALLSIKEDRVSASLAGINVPRERSIAWGLSSFIAGLSGGVYAWYVAVFYPTTVFSLEISVFVIVFVLFGGIGTLVGPLIGSLVLYSFYNFIGISTPQYFQLSYGLLIIIFALFIPNGILSIFEKRGIHVP